MNKWYYGWLVVLSVGLLTLTYHVGVMNRAMKQVAEKQADADKWTWTVPRSKQSLTGSVTIPTLGPGQSVTMSIPGPVKERPICSNGTSTWYADAKGVCHGSSWEQGIAAFFDELDCWAIFNPKDNPKAIYPVYFRSIANDSGDRMCLSADAWGRLRVTTTAAEYATAVIERIGIRR